MLAQLRHFLPAAPVSAYVHYGAQPPEYAWLPCEEKLTSQEEKCS